MQLLPRDRTEQPGRHSIQHVLVQTGEVSNAHWPAVLTVAHSCEALPTANTTIFKTWSLSDMMNATSTDGPSDSDWQTLTSEFLLGKFFPFEQDGDAYLYTVAAPTLHSQLSVAATSTVPSLPDASSAGY